MINILSSTFILLAVIISFNCAAVIKQVETIVETYPVTYIVENSFGGIEEVNGVEENIYSTVIEDNVEISDIDNSTKTDVEGTTSTEGKHRHQGGKEKQKGKENTDLFEITGDNEDGVSKYVDKRDAVDGDSKATGEVAPAGVSEEPKKSVADDGSSSTGNVDIATSPASDSKPTDQQITPLSTDDASKDKASQIQSTVDSKDSTSTSASKTESPISTEKSPTISSPLDVNSTTIVTTPDANDSSTASKIVITSTATIPATITPQPSSGNNILSVHHYTTILIVITLSLNNLL